MQLTAKVPPRPRSARVVADRRVTLVAAAIPLVFLLVFYVAPIGQLVVVGFEEKNGPTLKYYQKIWSNSYYVDAFISTILIALAVAITCLVLGYLAAYYLARSRSSLLRSILFITVLSPLLTSVIVRTYGWLVLLAPNGAVAKLWQAVLPTNPPQMLYNLPAAYVATVHVLLPFAILPLSAGISGLSRNLETASESLGASRMRTFVKVTLPLTLPSIAVSVTLVFVLAMGIYVTPLVVGGTSVPLAGIRVYQEVFGLNDYPTASALGFSLLGLTFICTALLTLIFSRARRWVRVD